MRKFLKSYFPILNKKGHLPVVNTAAPLVSAPRKAHVGAAGMLGHAHILPGVTLSHVTQQAETAFAFLICEGQIQPVGGYPKEVELRYDQLTNVG